VYICSSVTSPMAVTAARRIYLAAANAGWFNGRQFQHVRRVSIRPPEKPMSNRSYLCGTNLDTIYPAFVEQEYDSDKQTIASDVEAVPLLWLALFREDDLRREVFDADGEEVPAYAPICATAKALEQLHAALPYLNRVFSAEGPFDDYISMLRKAIEQAGYQYITIELEEISGLYPEEHKFDELLTLGIRGFSQPDGVHLICPDVEVPLPDFEQVMEGPAGDLADLLDNLGPGEELTFQFKSSGKTATIPGFAIESHRDVLLQLSQLRSGLKLPSARMYLDDQAYSDDDQWNFTRAIGAGREGSLGAGREAPWEKEGADYGFRFIPYDDDEDE
jgi:hypothetical protein